MANGAKRSDQWLENNGVTITAKESGPDILSRLLVSFLPWLIIIGLFIFFWQRMQRQMGGQQGGGLFSMGKSKAKRYIAGADNAKKDLAEIVDYLKNPDYYQRLGAKLPRGLLMVGAPGTGKTLMARAVAGEANVPFFSISGSEFIEMFVGAALFAGRDESKVIMGAKREQNLSDEEKKVIAFHESGHPLTALLFPKANTLFEEETLEASDIDSLLDIKARGDS